LCAELNISWHSIHYLKFQRPVYAPIKYALQAVHTLALLLRERPHLVFVQDPPIFASLFVYFYSILTSRQAHFIVDAHTGALAHPWWEPFRGLQRYIYRRALTVITTNQARTDLVRNWGADSIVLADPPASLPSGEAARLGQSFNIVLVNSFSRDEPLPAALEAVRTMSGVHLYVTGDANKADPDLLETAPDNVTFTGFLPDDEYLKLMRGVHAVMILTNEDFTMQSGAIEATSLGKPMIMSDLSFLREYFNRGTVYVENSSQAIQQGILKMQEKRATLEEEMLLLQREHRLKWAEEFAGLIRFIENRLSTSFFPVQDRKG
jgi:glycosyltransferase involved in cell wall biosynthesis